MPAPVASGGSESPGGPCTHWKAPPCHGARGNRTFVDTLYRCPILRTDGVSGLDLPFAARRAAPGEAVVAACSAGDDVMLYEVASHPARAKYSEHSVGARAVRLRIAPRIRVSGPSGLGCIQPRYAVEQQSVVLGRETLAPGTATFSKP